MHRYSTLDRRQYVRVCECGCGQPTLIAWGSDPKRGRQHMQPCPFLRGHATRGAHRKHRVNKARVVGDIAYIRIGTKATGEPIEAIIDAADLPRVLAYARWWSQWYPKTQAYYVRGRHQLLLHRFILDAPADLVVDHKNHDTLDCRRENMRLCTNAQNIQNRRGATKRSKTGIRGVSWDKSHSLWRAQVCVGGRKVHIGYAHDLREAETMAIEARRHLLTHTLN